MTNADPVGSSELENSGGNIHKLVRAGAVFQQTESGDQKRLGENDLSALLRQVSRISMSEINQLINELQTLRRRLQTDADRIQHDIEAYAGLTQQVSQITSIITDTEKRLPTSPDTDP
jgi:hypothetical protein